MFVVRLGAVLAHRLPRVKESGGTYCSSSMMDSFPYRVVRPVSMCRSSIRYKSRSTSLCNTGNHIKFLFLPGTDDNCTLSSTTASVIPDKKTAKILHQRLEKHLKLIMGVNIVLLNNQIHLKTNLTKTMKIMIHHFLMHLKRCNISF